MDGKHDIKPAKIKQTIGFCGKKVSTILLNLSSKQLNQQLLFNKTGLLLLVVVASIIMLGWD